MLCTLDGEELESGLETAVNHCDAEAGNMHLAWELMSGARCLSAQLHDTQCCHVSIPFMKS